MKYQIKVHYTTGDSFNCYETSSIIEISWENLSVAKENLKRIKNHYICYKVDNEYSGKESYYFKEQLTDDEKLMYDTRKNQDWYVNSKNKFEYQNCIKLYTDTGNVFQIYPSWVGHFEILHEAEIIIDPTEMKIKF